MRMPQYLLGKKMALMARKQSYCLSPIVRTCEQHPIIYNLHITDVGLRIGIPEMTAKQVWAIGRQAKSIRLLKLIYIPVSKHIFKSDKNYRGFYLMNIGFNPKVDRTRTSVVLSVEAL